ncbi:unnamed protein product, partial [Meganyctiphanes norvegica]
CRGRHHQRSACFQFQLGDLQSSLRRVVVESASLWVWKLQDKADGLEPQMIRIRQLHHHKHTTNSQPSIEDTLPISHAMTTTTTGWMEINLKEVVQQWVTEGRTEVTLEVSCPTCLTEHSLPVDISVDNRPFIVINSTEAKFGHNRAMSLLRISFRGGCRRTCGGGGGGVGWDWIVHPQGFHFYFCRGSCNSATVAAANSAHSSYLRILHTKRMQPGLDPEIRAALATCCTPTRFSPLPILHQEGSAVKLVNIPDMIVE